MPGLRSYFGKRSKDREARQLRQRMNIPATAGGGGVTDHGALTGLADDDHANYVHLTNARTILAQHSFSPASAQAPFLLGANAQSQLVTGLRADQLNKAVIAGAGLITGGTLTADVTVNVGDGDGLVVNADDIALGTPGTLSVSSTDGVTASSHTHAITSSAAPGAAASLLASDASGHLQLVRLGIGITPSNPIHIRSATTPQIRIENDATYWSAIRTQSDGDMQIEAYKHLRLTPDQYVIMAPTGGIVQITGELGIGVTPTYSLQIQATDTPQFRIGYDATNYMTISVSSLGRVSMTNAVQDDFQIIGHVSVGSAAPAAVGGEFEVSGPTYQQFRMNDGAGTMAMDIGSTGKLIIFSGQNMEFRPVGDLIFNPGGSDIYPLNSYDIDLGTVEKQWREIHAAELWVGTLVAWTQLATIGGSIIVAPSTELIALMTGAATNMDVKHQLTSGSFCLLKADNKTEWLQVTDAGTPITGGYRHTVTRGLDGTGHQYYAGDAVVSTGGDGGGYLDIYSQQAISSGTGPTITGVVRDGSLYNDLFTAWTVGNLEGNYGYATETYGAGFGLYATGYNYLTVDDTDGVSFYDTAQTLIGRLSSTAWTLGYTSAEHIRISPTAIEFKDSTTIYGVLSATNWTLGLDSGSRVVITPTAIEMHDSGDDQWLDISSAGIVLYNTLGSSAVVIEPDGDIRIGADTTAAATTYFSLFSVSSGSYAAGDLVTGAYGTGDHNMWWDTANSKLHFRVAEAASVIWVDSAGAFVAGAGDVTIDADGLTLALASADPGAFAPANVKWGTEASIRSWSSATVTSLTIYTDGDTPGKYAYINLTAEADATRNARIRFNVDTGGSLEIFEIAYPSGAAAYANWGGRLELGTAVGAAAAKLEVYTTSTHILLSRDASNYATLAVAADGVLTIDTVYSTGEGGVNIIEGLRVGDGTDPTNDDIRATADIVAGGGIYAGTVTANPTNGNIYATGDIYAGSGMTVGNTSTAPADDELIVVDRIWVGDVSYIGNNKMTTGIQVRIVGDDYGFAMKQANITHGATVIAPTDMVFGVDAWSVAGGAVIRGIGDGSQARGLHLYGLTQTQDIAAPSTSSKGVVMTEAADVNGTSHQQTGTNACIFVVTNNDSSRMVVRGDGRMYTAASASGTANTVADFDDYEDMPLLHGIRASLSHAESKLRRRFGEFIDYARPVMEASEIIIYNDGPGGDGVPFVDHLGLQMVTIDALRQFHGQQTIINEDIYTRLRRYEKAFLSLGLDPVLLEA